jgi:hypothetical protein
VAVGVEPAPAWVLGPEHLLEALVGAGLKFVHFPLGVVDFVL